MNIDLRPLYTTLRDQLGPVGHWWPHESRTEQAVGAVLVQQNRWEAAAASVAALRDHDLLDPDRLAAATPAEVAVSIRPSGLVRAKSAALPALGRWMAEHETEAESWSDEELNDSLWSLPLVGPETADVIALYGYARPRFVADAYARRLLSALGREVPRSYEATRRALDAAWTAAEMTAEEAAEFHGLIVEHGKRGLPTPWMEG